MKEFKLLAKKINLLGDIHIKKYGEKSFSSFASEMLSKTKFDRVFDAKEFITSSFLSLPSQHFKYLEFSDLPVTVSVGKSCFIDLYFWRRRSTVIHNHHFRGAFTCLLGKNLDFDYEFERTRKLSKFFDLGNLHLKEKRQIHVGDVVEISYLDKFIHQNHHHADLTVNLCFRTPQDKKRDLSNYLHSGLRYSRNESLIENTMRLKRCLDLGVIDLKRMKISPDHALMFLLVFNESSDLETKKYLEKLLKTEFKINIQKLLESHDKKFSQLEDFYE